MSSKEVKINENRDITDQKSNKKYTTKSNKDYNNFNETITNTLNQQQDAINKILDNTLHNIKKSTYQASKQIPQYTQRIAEFQEQNIQMLKEIASDFIEAEKQIVASFQINGDRNNNVNFTDDLWDLYNPQRIAENHIVSVSNFTIYLSNTNNLINDALVSNLGVYNRALKQTQDDVNAFAKANTNTNHIKSATVYNKDANTFIP
ncbi:MAG: hypothetical protein MRJ93_01615 [Nitrososphaeraceae archaeon]|nr:hypothetical protein [Nitrososphaeraceae archaeon]